MNTKKPDAEGRHPTADRLKRNLLEVCDESLADAIAFGTPLPAGATDEEKAAWVRHVVAGLETHLSGQDIRTVMMGCHCEDLCRLGEMKQHLGKLYRESASLEEFVEKVNEHGAGWRLEDGALYTKFLWCECHMLKNIEQLSSTTWCHCTEGYTKALFEHVLGCEVESELVRTIKTGHECCVVKIVPKQPPIRA